MPGKGDHQVITGGREGTPGEVLSIPGAVRRCGYQIIWRDSTKVKATVVGSSADGNRRRSDLIGEIL